MFFNKIFSASSKSEPEQQPATTLAKMTSSEKELRIVQITTDDHMRLLTGFPFVWNQRIKKNTNPRTHAYCYMNIVGENVDIVKSVLNNINNIIKSDLMGKKNIPPLEIPLNGLVFNENNLYGYSHFICSPITLTGKISKYPITLFFSTNLQKVGNTTHGELIYGAGGSIQKANIYFWRNNRGYFLYYKTIDGMFVLDKIITN